MSEYIGLFKRFRKNSALNRQYEEKLYAYVSQEIKAGYFREGLWTKAKVIAKGNTEKIEAEYINLRVQSIKDEYVVIEDFLNEIEKIDFKNEQEFKKLIAKEKNKSEDI